MEHNRVEIELSNSIKDSSLEKLTSDILEVGIDQLITEGILREIPVIKSIFNITKIGLNINDKILTKKLLIFLFQIHSIPNEKRVKFIHRLEENKEFNSKVGESLLLIIDKIDDFEKPRIVGNLFRATIEGKITYQAFLYLAFLVNNSFSLHLNKLKSVFDKDFIDLNKLDSYEKNSLYNSGIIEAGKTVDMSEQKRLQKMAGTKVFDSEKVLNSLIESQNNLEVSEAGKQILLYGY